MTDRKKDRHSKQNKRHSPDFRFCGIDGEGIKTATGDKYVLLQADTYPPLIDLNGLSTKAICDWLMQIDGEACLVGYGFNYDFENFFRDLPDVEYINLVNGYAVYHEGYTLSYVPRKILRVLEGHHLSYDGRLYYGKGERRTIYNCISFFQTTFVKALQSFGLDHLVTAEIEHGKAARGTFTAADLPSMIRYNAQECAALTKLMTNFWEQCKNGFRLANVPIALRKRDSYGPGAFASAFLKSINWTETYQSCWYDTKAFCTDLDNRMLKGIESLETDEHKNLLIRHFPFSAAFFGGRIELAAVGQFDRVYNYDIVSAYPAAMTRLPVWDVRAAIFTRTRKHIKRQLDKRSIAMMLCRWEFPKRWQWYPFPYRSAGKNVFFPREGLGWIMSPEYFAAVDTGAARYIEVEAIYYLKGTAPHGDGTKRLDDDTRTQSAREIEALYTLRREFKQSSDLLVRGGQLPLKLTLNSCYGKLLQQIGASIENPKFFNDVIAAWITSWTRATIWRAIAGYSGHEIIAVQTDGIYSQVPLALDFGSELGQWDQTECRDLIKLLPGIYQYTDEAGKRHSKQRGQTRFFEHEEARRKLYGERDSYSYTYPCFIGNRHAIAQPLAYGDKRLQWVDVVKEYRADLGSKRASPRDIKLKAAHKFYPPKENQTAEFCSRPFALKFEKTPYLISTPDAMLEDCEGEDGLFIAGISE